ncbi:MAG: hypothetical protein RIT22_556 [Bacteroidota bacterium]|jgi:hypothetical protein
MREKVQVQPTRKSHWLSQINAVLIAVVGTIQQTPTWFCKPLSFFTFCTPIYIGQKNRTTSCTSRGHSTPLCRLVLFELPALKNPFLFFRLE